MLVARALIALSPADQAAIVRLLQFAFVIAVVVFLVRVFRRGPYGLRQRVPLGMTALPRVTWTQRPFLGWARSLWGGSSWVVGTDSDTTGVVGPHGSGKTFGVLIPQLLLWGGPAISTSTKPDVIRATAGRRLGLAEELGGRLYVYAPTSAPGELVEGLRPIRWSPLAGCEDTRVATLRVDALVNTARVGAGVEDPSHWRAGAARLLRPYFLAASHHFVPERRGDLTVVHDWLSRREFDEPLAILDGLGTFEGDQWANQLRGVADTPPRELGSFFSAADNALAATADPKVLRSTTATDLDPVEFLTTGSTLYVVSPSEHQAAVAPLISALVESIVVAAYDLFRAGRLDRRVLLSLDELANIAPLASLGSIASQGTSQGVNLSWAAQSVAQLRERYGQDMAYAIWSESTAKVVFGGMADAPLLNDLSALVGDRVVTMKGSASSWMFGRQRTRTAMYRPRMTPADLAQLRQGWALLLYRPAQAFAIRVPIAPKRLAFRAALLPWPAPAPAADAAPVRTVEGA
jgi:type IV secretory pathway TraG/TraD family ATPase VirD4